MVNDESSLGTIRRPIVVLCELCSESSGDSTNWSATNQVFHSPSTAALMALLPLLPSERFLRLCNPWQSLCIISCLARMTPPLQAGLHTLCALVRVSFSTRRVSPGQIHSTRYLACQLEFLSRVRRDQKQLCEAGPLPTASCRHAGVRRRRANGIRNHDRIEKKQLPVKFPCRQDNSTSKAMRGPVASLPVSPSCGDLDIAVMTHRTVGQTSH